MQQLNEYRVIGPPGCIAGDAIIDFMREDSVTGALVEDFSELAIFVEFAGSCLATGRKVWTKSLRRDGSVAWCRVIRAMKSGEKEVFLITLEDKKKVAATADHEFYFFTHNGQGKIRVRDMKVNETQVAAFERWEVDHPSNTRVTSIRRLGVVPTFDLTVAVEAGESGNYFASGVCVSNCGKTFYLQNQVKARLDHWCGQTGLPPSQCSDILICSMTKAAAAEIGSRAGDLPEDQVGTLHSHAYQALGRPKLCVGAKAIKQWNSESSMNHWLSGGGTSREEDGFSIGVGKYRGDELNAEYTVNRCKLIPREMWRPEVQEFAKEFERWKFLNSFMDYEDLIEKAFLEKTDPPGNPSTILGDEQQDSSLADLRLMRYWGQKCSKLILVGDTDQAIFGFRGADPEGFYATEIPEDHTKVLEQSFRVPRRVHETAMRMIQRIPDRKQVVYRPRDEEGEVTRTTYSMRGDAHAAVREVERMLDEPDTAPGRPKVMALFACSYMAAPFTAALRAAGIPYWNPYSGDRGTFNPLHPGNGVSTLQRILAYLKPNEQCYGEEAKVWTWGELNSWVELCNAEGWLRHGAKTRIKHQASALPGQVLNADDLEGLLAGDNVMADLAECNLEFLGRHIADAKRNTFDFVLDVVKKRGYNDLRKNPRVVVSTAHGAKGTEADNVFVCPDLSVSGWETFGNRATRDSIHRLFYVALTRARHKLVLTSPLNQQAVQW